MAFRRSGVFIVVGAIVAIGVVTALAIRAQSRPVESTTLTGSTELRLADSSEVPTVFSGDPRRGESWADYLAMRFTTARVPSRMTRSQAINSVCGAEYAGSADARFVLMSSDAPRCGVADCRNRPVWIVTVHEVRQVAEDVSSAPGSPDGAPNYVASTKKVVVDDATGEVIDSIVFAAGSLPQDEIER